MDGSEHSVASSAIFSPVPSDVQTASQAGDSTLTPLTISAHDIEGGSMDFTELANPDFNLSLHPTPLSLSNESDAPSNVSGVPKTKMNNGIKLDDESVVAVNKNKENAFAPPKSTSSPFGPVRVRVSAKKLREIQSPYDSFASNSSVGTKSPLCSSDVRRTLSTEAYSVKQTHTNDGITSRSIETRSLPLTGDVEGTPMMKVRPSFPESVLMDETAPSTPRALGPVHITTGKSRGNVQKQEEQNYGSKNPLQVRSTKTGLSQGILQTGDTAESPVQDISTESVLVQPGRRPSLSSQDTLQESKEKLLQRKFKTAYLGTSQAKAKYHVHQIQASSLGMSSVNTSGHESTSVMAKDQGPKSVIPVGDSPTLGVSEVSETAKLVATCTAAATAAVMATRKPQSEMFYDQSFKSKQLPADLTAYTNCPPVKINTLQVQPTLINKPGEVTKNGITGLTENHPGRQGLIYESDFKEDDVTGQVLAAESANPNTKHRLDQTGRPLVPRESNANTNNPTKIDFNPETTNTAKSHSKQSASQHSPMTQHEALRSQCSSKKGKYAHVRPDNSIKMRTAFPSVDAMHSIGEFKVRMGDMQTQLKDSTDETSLHYKDILKRLERIEEVQHARTMGEIQGPTQVHYSAFSGGGKQTYEQAPMELPPRQGKEAKEPVSHTQPISSCNYPFSSVHHSSVRIPQPLNTQSTNDPVCTGSSEGACDTCFKSEKPEEVKRTKSMGQNLSGRGLPSISKEGHMFTSGAPSHCGTTTTLSEDKSVEQSIKPPPGMKQSNAIDSNVKDVKTRCDVVSNVSNVLRDVQMARKNLELQCALAETEEHYTDMGRLLQSLEMTSNVNEFTDISWKVSQLLLKQKESLKLSEEEMKKDSVPHPEVKGHPPERRVKPRLGVMNNERRRKGAQSILKVSREDGTQRAALSNQVQVATRLQGTTVGNQPKGSKSFPSHTSPPSLPLNLAKLPKRGHQAQQVQSKSSRVPLPNVAAPLSREHHPLPYKHKQDLPTACHHSRPSSQLQTLHLQSHPPDTTQRQTLHLQSHPPDTLPSAQLQTLHLQSHPPDTTQHQTLHLQSHPPDTLPFIGTRSQYGIESAIPIGPPCIMPSPQYVLIESTRVEKASQTQIESSDDPQSKDNDPLVTPYQDDQDLYLKPTTADACLQTSLNSTRETSDSVQVNHAAMDKARPNEQGHLTSDSNNEGSSECSHELADQPAAETAITVDGRHRSPTHTLSPLQPSHMAHKTSKALEALSSEELNEKLQKQLESRATEWVHQELMARMLSQIDPICDPIASSRPFEPPNSCSTCSLTPDPGDIALAPLLGPDGMQVFVDAGVPVDNGTVVKAVKDAIKKELVHVAQEMNNSPTTEPPDKGQSIEEDDEQYSYTPPESCTVSSSSLSVTDTPPLSTPHPTPPSSHTSTPEHTLTHVELTAGEAGGEICGTPSPTPPLSLHDQSTDISSIDHETVTTPQESPDEYSTADATINKSLALSDHTQPEVSTPVTTPSPVPISVGSPPQSTLEVIDSTPHTTHTKEIPSSESSTTSTSSHRHSLTPTPSSTSTSSTDRGISLGEYVRKKPALPVPNTSVSEGEVPLSPGDVRWHSLFSKTIGSGKHPRVDPTIEAFLDLKNSPDPSLSDSQDSQPSESKIFSVGEVGNERSGPPRLADPFERFLHKLNTSTPDDSSSLDGDTKETTPTDNTLSELPSIRFDESKLLIPEVTPGITKPQGHQRRGRLLAHSRPYDSRSRFRKRQVGHTSPGEIAVTQKGAGAAVKDKGFDGEQSSISFPHSEGELPTRITLLKKDNKKGSKQTSATQLRQSVLDESVQTLNETRYGIDVINVSRQSSRSKSRKKQSESAEFLETYELDKPEGHSSRSSSRAGIDKCSLNGELPRVIQVQPTPTVKHPSNTKEKPSTVHDDQPVSSQSNDLPSLSLGRSQSGSSVVATGDLPLDLGLSELELSTLESVHSQPLPLSPPLQSKLYPHRAPITVTIPTASHDISITNSMTERSVSSYSSDFDFSSVTIPGVD